MKRLFLTLLIVFLGVFSVKALSYEEARREAWFLTDKMAYELNLTPDQYDMAYQVNLDYFLSIRRASDCNGRYWRYRDSDLRYILSRWQYDLYSTLDYFFRPIRWRHSCWYYPVCSHYRTGYYYFKRPVVYVSYRGNSWRGRGYNDISPYRGFTIRAGVGLRDSYYRGKGHKPQYRPDFGRPSRYDRDDDDRFERDDDDDDRYDRKKRPGRDWKPVNGIRPNRDWKSDHERRPGHLIIKDRDDKRRQSRDFKRGEDRRERVQRHSAKSKERPKREFDDD